MNQRKRESIGIFILENSNSSRIRLRLAKRVPVKPSGIGNTEAFPRDNGVNLGSHDNRASTRITYFKDSHPLAKDGSAILVS